MKQSVLPATLQIVGHRGARGLAPENTLKALEKALQHGVHEVEVDVHVTQDGIAVLCHNAWITDPAGTKLRINDTPYASLVTHKPDLPTLEAAITFINRRVPIQLEVKWGEPTTPVISIVRHFIHQGWQPTDFLIASKKQRTLRELHRALPDIPTVVIEPYLSIRAHWRVRQVNAKRVSMNKYGLWGGFIQAMSRNGLQLYAYTLDDPIKAAAWHSRGLHGVITDYPDRYQKPEDKQ